MHHDFNNSSNIFLNFLNGMYEAFTPENVQNIRLPVLQMQLNLQNAAGLILAPYQTEQHRAFHGKQQ